MSYRPFSRRKKNEAKNLEAVELFNTYNRLVPTTRARYVKVIDEFAEFLILHKKSLWDVIEEDIRKYFLDNDSPHTRTILNTFYRILIQTGEYLRSNPIEMYIQLEKREKERGIVRREISSDATATLLQEQLGEDEDEFEVVKTERPKSVVGKKLVTNTDLEKLLIRVKSIRDRTILIMFFSTGIKLKELINLLLSDVDIEARQVSIKSLNPSDDPNDEHNYRTILLPRRTISYLRIYERWRRRILSPVPYYFITTGKQKKQMSASAITNWLKRLQKDRPRVDRWTAMDFRKRALLQQYWITRDLTAVARFGGYRRPESALRLIADALHEQGVDSIEKLGSAGEFDKIQKTKSATVSDLDNLTVTVELQQSDLEFISKTGQTPTQFVRSLLRYQAGGGTPVTIASTPVDKPAATPSVSEGPSSGPSSGPSAGGPSGSPTPSSGPSLSTAPPSGGPKLGIAPPSSGPKLGTAPKSGPNLMAKSPEGPSSGPGGPSSGPGGPGGAPAMSLSSSIKDALSGLSSAPEGDKPKPAAAPVSAPPGGQMGELASLLARRRAISDGELEPDPIPSSSSPFEATIRDANPIEDNATEDKEDGDEDEIPDLPDFDM